jgi:O-antigen ligase
VGLTTPVKLGGAVIAAIWVFRLLDRHSRMRFILVDRPLVAWSAIGLVAFAAISSLWAADSGAALSSAFRLFQGVLLLFITYSVVSDRKRLAWVLAAFVGGSLFAVLLGFFGTYSASTSVNDARLSGGFDDPNELAAVVLPSIVFCAYGFAALGDRLIRWALVPIAMLLAVALLRTDSQAGLVALAVALLLALMFSGDLRRRAALVVAALVVVGTVFYTVVTEPVAFQTIFSSGNTSNRESLWAVAAAMVSDQPILGVGAGNFSVLEPFYAVRGINLPRVELITEGELAHSSYLQVLAEMGVVGLAAFLSIIALTLVAGVRAVRALERARDVAAERLARAVVIGTAAMLVAYFFATNHYEKQLWLMLGTCVAMSSVARSSLGAGLSSRPPSR